MDIEKINNKIYEELDLTSEEANYFLTYYCNMIKHHYYLDDPNNNDYRVCFATSHDLEYLMAVRFNLYVSRLDISKLLNIPLTHYSDVVTINIDGKRKVYLVDLTYKQFFKEDEDLKKYYEDNNEEIGYVLFDDYIKSNKEKYFVDSLLNSGFIELNDELLRIYINSFLYKYNKRDDINTYQKVIDNIKKEVFIDVSKIKYTKEELILLERLRNDILNIMDDREQDTKGKSY